MSYSFSVNAPTKEGAIAAVVNELNKVVNNQPEHAADIPAAKEAAKAFINVLLDPDETECVGVTMWGSLGWRPDRSINGSSLSVSAGISKRGS